MEEEGDADETYAATAKGLLRSMRIRKTVNLPKTPASAFGDSGTGFLFSEADRSLLKWRAMQFILKSQFDSVCSCLRLAPDSIEVSYG